jgi:hypothetical protein
MHRTSPVWSTPQTCPGLQAFPQAPQFSVVVSDVSHPFASLPSQLSYPLLHFSFPHWLFRQPKYMFGWGVPSPTPLQAVPHSPQLLSSTRGSVQGGKLFGQ